MREFTRECVGVRRDRRDQAIGSWLRVDLVDGQIQREEQRKARARCNRLSKLDIGDTLQWITGAMTAGEFVLFLDEIELIRECDS